MKKKSENIRIAAICGSVRRGSYTAMALKIAVEELRARKITADEIDPSVLKLSMPGIRESSDAQTMRKTISGATGVILATPEYHGSYSSVMKLVIDNLGFPSVLSGKPVVLLGVAAGAIGAIKALEHLKSVCSHVGAVVFPAAVSVPRIQESFDESGRCSNPDVEKRIRSVSTHLIDYIHKHICPGIAFEEWVRGKA